MINKLLKTFFSEKKACITLIRSTPESNYNVGLYKENIRKSKYIKQSVETCLSSYFSNNKGLNCSERNYF